MEAEANGLYKRCNHCNGVGYGYTKDSGLTMKEVQVDITDINISYSKLYSDGQTVSKAFGQLTVNYTVLFQCVYKTEGTLIINEGDQDTHDHIENLTVNYITYIVANRLGVYKASSDK
ncbi:hypothetical protein [Priestia megaterium]|uniref:hypothetical protein n=1 Tax=Priestia megaterium TaxID=1404 RepID=UPI00300AFDFD